MKRSLKNNVIFHDAVEGHVTKYVCCKNEHEWYLSLAGLPRGLLCDLSELVELACERGVGLRVHGRQAAEFDPHVHPTRKHTHSILAHVQPTC